MNIFSRILNRLTRITSRGDFIPEIDGLRFLAILQVLLLHCFTFIMVKAPNGSYEERVLDYPFLKAVLGNGGSGVLLFFAISGFILSLPFAQYYLNGGRKINLKSYYIRRVTRIEPPYIISLVFLFLVNVYVVGKYSFG
ncbi:MAG: acyltransferase family protein, partial [Planctomycetes bacterium]|nr:acyltransferase family protein [Planctomycetota bacterium]